MKTELQISRVQDCLLWLQDGEAFTHSQSINFLIDKLGELVVSLAFVNEQMAISKRVLNEKKVAAYNSLAASETANAQYYAPSLAKDYINGKLSEEQFNFDLCSRTSATIVHSVDAIRTAISALKIEQQYSNVA